jgi:hypothetical protein
LKSGGRHGKRVKLWFLINDDSGRARVVIILRKRSGKKVRVHGADQLRVRLP